MYPISKSAQAKEIGNADLLHSLATLNLFKRTYFVFESYDSGFLCVNKTRVQNRKCHSHSARAVSYTHLGLLTPSIV